MRKTLAIVLCIIMVLSLASFSVFAEGATEIKTAAEFATMAADGNYKLGADITISETYATDFTGTFDGNGYTVTVSVPMFNKVNGTVKNLKVKGAISATAKCDLGAVASYTAGGTFEDITNETSITCTYTLAKNDAVRIGGIVGYANSSPATFTRCINKADISGPEATGGILGESQKTGTSFTDCKNYGKITCVESKVSGVAAGGIYGYSGSGKVLVTNCENYGEITSSYVAGGIIGDARKTADLTDCVNYGKVTGASASGGLIGYIGDSSTETSDVFLRCINFGDVYDTNRAGGLVGYHYGSGKKSYMDIQQCINNGDVSGGKFCSEFIAYSNTWNTTIKDSIGAGELKSVAVENFPTKFVIVGCSGTQTVSIKLENVYLADNGTTEWLSWTETATNLQSRIPLSACLGKDLNGVEFEAPEYDGTNYTVVSSSVKITANDTISAKDGETVVGVRVKAITRIELSDATLKAFSDKVGFDVHLENGNVLFGAKQVPPTTGDTAIWVAVCAFVSLFGMGIAIKAKNR